MASPWKFLSRLVSPRRQKGQGDEQVDGVDPEEPGIASTAKRLDKGSLAPVNTADGPATPNGAPGPAEDHHQKTLETDGSKVDDVSRRQLLATVAIPADGASNVEDASEAPPARRKRRTRTVEPVVAASNASPAVLAASDDETSLDDEIRALRDQLAKKLRQQNAQLKKMLERFEP